MLHKILPKIEDLTLIHIISLITTAFNIFQKNIYEKYVKIKTSKKANHIEISSGLPVGVLYESTQFPSNSDGEKLLFKKTDTTTVSDESGSKKQHRIISSNRRIQMKAMYSLAL